MLFFITVMIQRVRGMGKNWPTLILKKKAQKGTYYYSLFYFSSFFAICWAFRPKNTFFKKCSSLLLHSYNDSKNWGVKLGWLGKQKKTISMRLHYDAERHRKKGQYSWKLKKMPLHNTLFFSLAFMFTGGARVALFSTGNQENHLMSQISARKSGSRLLTSLRSKHVLELRLPRLLSSTRVPKSLAKATIGSFFLWDITYERRAST